MQGFGTTRGSHGLKKAKTKTDKAYSYSLGAHTRRSQRGVLFLALVSCVHTAFLLALCAGVLAELARISMLPQDARMKLRMIGHPDEWGA